MKRPQLCDYAACGLAAVTAIGQWLFCREHAKREHLDADHDQIAGDVIDDVAVVRRASGDRTVTLTRAETAEAFQHLLNLGLTSEEIAERLGVTPRTVYRWRHGMRPYALRAEGRQLHAVR